MHHGTKIKELVREKRYSSKEFAELLGVSQKYIYHLYKQESVTFKILKKVSKIFEKDFYYFFKNGKKSELNESIVEYGENYVKDYIKSLERENNLLRENILRLQNKLDNLKKKSGN